MSRSSLAPQEPDPTPAAQLRASDADRDQVAQVLSTAFAEGRITAEEHAERLDTVMQAKTFAELIPVTNDLIPATESPTLSSAVQSNAAQLPTDQVDTPDSAHPLIDTSRDSGPDRIIALFGGARRKGRYRMRRSSQALAAFGGIEIDLTDAVFEAPVVELTCLAAFGGIDITVPPGVEIHDQTVGIFGGTSVPDSPGDSGAPKVILKGLAIFGGVQVSEPKKGSRRNHGGCR